MSNTVEVRTYCIKKKSRIYFKFPVFVVIILTSCCAETHNDPFKFKASIKIFCNDAATCDIHRAVKGLICHKYLTV